MAAEAREATDSPGQYVDYDYDRFYSQHDFDYEERVETAFLELLLRRLARLPAGATILDVGCGTGFDAWLMDRMGFRAVGVDTSRIAIERARRRDGGARFVHGDARVQAEGMGSAFDLVYSSGFMPFNWVPSLRDASAVAVARELLGYCRPGGQVAFVWDSYLTGRRWSPYTDVRAERMYMNYTVSQVRELWERAGDCHIRHAGVTHKRLARVLGQMAFSFPMTMSLTAACRALRRPAQVVTIVQRGNRLNARGS